MRALFNCTHSRGGGGLTWARELCKRLDNGELLASLGITTKFDWYICAPAESWATIEPPAKWPRWEAPVGWRSHVWEQLKLPRLVWQHGISACLCNANYGPLLLPRTCALIPLLHTETGQQPITLAPEEILRRLREATR